MKISEKRNYGIDLLRITAMVMVGILHTLRQGGALDGLTPQMNQYKAGWFLEIAAFCAVNCYALISGYVGIRAKYKYSNFAVLWLRVVFYTISITIVYAVFFPGTVGTPQWLGAIFPVMGYQYWYFTAYFGLFLFIPVLNMGMNALSRRQAKMLVIGLIAGFSFLQTLFCGLGFENFPTNAFATSSGYSTLWLIVLYVIGSYLGKYRVLEKWPAWKLFLGYAFLCVCTWLFKMGMRTSASEFLRNSKMDSALVSYVSPTILGAGIFLVLMFERLHLPLAVKKAVAFLSPCAFSVYLIHTNKLVWNNLIDGLFERYASLRTLLYVPAVLGSALAIFAVCIAIDLVREWIFRKLRVKERLERCMRER